jgi:cbb3-type cytochrome oxidase subunit 1
MQADNQNSAPVAYNYKVVQQFTVMTVVWGIVGMFVGVLIAAQLVWPDLNFGQAWLSFGRLRPLHTNAVIFALWRQCVDRHLVLYRAAHLPSAPDFRLTCRLCVLGLAVGDCARRYHPTHGALHQ